MKFETLAIHAGQEPDPSNGAVMTPVYFTSTYMQDGVGKPRQGYEYSRTMNPTREALQECLAALEGGLNLMRLTIALPVGALAGGLASSRLGYGVTTAAGLGLAAAGFFGLTTWDESPGQLLLTGPLLVAGGAPGEVTLSRWTPPKTADRVPDAQSSSCSIPGCRKCTWPSIRPGRAWRPVPSIVSPAGTRDIAPGASSAEKRPSLIEILTGRWPPAFSASPAPP